MLSRQAEHRAGEHPHRTFCAVTDHQQIIAALRTEHGGGRIFDGNRFAQPRMHRRRLHRPIAAHAANRPSADFVEYRPERCLQTQSAPLAELTFSPPLAQSAIFCNANKYCSRRSSPQARRFETDDCRAPDRWHRCKSPRRAREQPRGGVFFAENQMRIGLAALQRNPHRHLPDRAAGQTVRAPKVCDPNSTCMPKRTALPDEPIEQQRRILRQLVVIGKQFLKFVDDQQNARQRICPRHGTIPRHILHARHRGTNRRGDATRRRDFRSRSGRIPARFRSQSPGRAANCAWRRF